LPISTEPARRSPAAPRDARDGSHEAFVGMDAGGYVIDWNVQAQHTFGWSSEEAIRRALGDLIIPRRYRASHLEGLRR
jgi:PAS domain S-box-containing protein